ncbi:homoserine kinase [Hymenobacter daecheongensis DSM 21074]|uniref:Homoserine kinase n=1 Tax=Hymenobacter daecheongensis DSM 21074 TaxID=1121955 RepID=A0A1M6AW11_9BACT|nr:homoserine kinase [Hymenobacter daecheongensis]SHI40665.1 homoserine kinase [Hymenobacter daecheongensis DSM 21074]
MNSLSPETITLHAPGTVANVVCGFDVLGFALSQPYDTMTMRLTTPRGVTIRNHDDYNLPTEPTRNVAGAALLALLKAVPEQVGFAVEITKGIKPGSGIGSSAASAAGAVVGANYLLGNRFTAAELVEFATYGEEVASGVRHADNIAPAIYGGITLIRSTTPLDIIPVPAPPLFVTVVHPQIEIRTADARAILKKQVPLQDAIRQWGNVGGLIAGLMKGDYDLIGRSLEDVIIEPVRSILIPCFAAVKAQSTAAGALGGGISGSGPSIFMLSKDEKTARRVEAAMREIYIAAGIDFHTYVSPINPTGVRILPAEAAATIRTSC